MVNKCLGICMKDVGKEDMVLGKEAFRYYALLAKILVILVAFGLVIGILTTFLSVAGTLTSIIGILSGFGAFCFLCFVAVPATIKTFRDSK